MKIISIGQKFRKLTVVSGPEKIKSTVYYTCKCECGNKAKVCVAHLLKGKTGSCGCLRREIEHGHSVGGVVTPTYQSWADMIKRCHGNKDNPDYKGRGIRVCDRWRYSFTNFLNDMGVRPDKFSIERNDVDGDYCPDNCQWILKNHQNINKRVTTWVTLDGKRMPASYAAKILGISQTTICRKIRLAGYIPGMDAKQLTR